jgi:hypothetical protein
MGLFTSVNKFVKRLLLNALNCYILYFLEENTKQLDEDEIIETLDQAKDKEPEWDEAVVNANIDIFEMTYEQSVSYFMRLENLEKIRRINSPNPSSLPVDNKKSLISRLGKSKNHKGPTCGVTIVTRATTARLIAKLSPNLSRRKRIRLDLKPKLDPERSL